MDLIGPDIGGVSFRTEGTADRDCRVYARTSVSDASGVAWVRLHYRFGGGDRRSVDMGHRGGDSYEAQIPGASGGESIEFKVEARDTKSWLSDTGNDSDNLPNCRVG